MFPSFIQEIELFKETLKIVGTLIILAICVPFIWWSWTHDKGASIASPAEQRISDAQHACQEMISDRLHDPSSADWGMNSGHWWRSWPVQDDGDTVTVTPIFRAKNALGSTVLSTWTCKVRETSDSWHLISLSQR
jgi:hypothetical protein